MHALIQSKLQEVINNYTKTSDLMEKLPDLAEFIASKVGCDGHFSGTITHHHRGAYFPWGINYHLHGENNPPGNYQGEWVDVKGLVSVYLNTTAMFGEHMRDYAHQELAEVAPSVKCVHYDHLNSKFYFDPNEVIAGLDILADWYHAVKSKTDVIKKQQEIKQLENQLAKLKAGNYEG